MVNSALTSSRGIPDLQATNYNDCLTAGARIRQRVELDGDARVFQISKLANAARAANQALLDQANANDAKLQAAVAPSTDVSAEAKADIRHMYSLGLSLAAICQQLVSDGYKEGFTALRREVRLQIRASKSGAAQAETFDTPSAIDQDLSIALGVISAYERKLLTPAEQAAALEARESDTNMGRVKDNWQVLDDFYAKQLLPSAVAGAFVRLHSIFAWAEVSGLDSDGSLLYTDQRSGSSRINLVSDVVPAVTWGTR